MVINCKVGECINLKLNKNKIDFLGASGGRNDKVRSTCLQVGKSILIDVGNAAQIQDDDMQKIEHIFLTHSHFDHIADLPFLIEGGFVKRENTLNIYGLKKTLDSVKNHIFNWEIWPDFSKIPLLNGKESLKFIEIEEFSSYKIEEFSFKPIRMSHTVESCGYVIGSAEDNNSSIFFTSDTKSCKAIWEELNQNKKIHSLVIDVSYPSNMEELSLKSGHFTPALLQEDLKLLSRNDLAIYIYHLKPSLYEQTKDEIETLMLTKNGGKILKDGDQIWF